MYYVNAWAICGRWVKVYLDCPVYVDFLCLGLLMIGPASALTFLTAMSILLLLVRGLILVGALATTMLLGNRATMSSTYETNLGMLCSSSEAWVVRWALLPIAYLTVRLDGLRLALTYGLSG